MAIDVQGVKGQVDIVGVVERYVALKRTGGRYMGLCPFHSENTPSLVVFPDSQSWYCFGGCQDGGDVVKFVMKAEGVGFVEAVEMLGHPPQSPQSVGGKMRPDRPGRVERKAPALEWQERAWEVVEYAEGVLWSAQGARAREYLHEQRGLRDGIIREARLGYVPGHWKQWVKVAGLKVPCGIVIPWLITPHSDRGRTQVWALKVRRAGGRIKYQQVAGGAGKGLYWVDRVRPDVPVMVTEGEFDCLVIAQATNIICPVSLGTAGNADIGAWIERLIFSPVIWARMDGDRAGRQALARLMALSARVRALDVPEAYKDINELWVEDKALFWEWLKGLSDAENCGW